MIVLQLILLLCVSAVQILHGPENITVMEGGSAIFYCNISVSAVPFWKIDGISYDSSGLPDRYVYFNSILTISNVSMTDDGTTYQCGVLGFSLSDTATLTVIGDDEEFTMATMAMSYMTAVATESLSASQSFIPTSSIVNTSTTTVTITTVPSTLMVIAVVVSIAFIILLFVMAPSIVCCCHLRSKKCDTFNVHPTQTEMAVSANNYEAIGTHTMDNDHQSNENHSQQEADISVYDVIPGEMNASEQRTNLENCTTSCSQLDGGQILNESIVDNILEDSNRECSQTADSPYCSHKKPNLRLYEAVQRHDITTSEGASEKTYSSLKYNLSAHKHVRMQEDTMQTAAEAQYSSLQHTVKALCHSADQYDVIAAKDSEISELEPTYSKLEIKSTLRPTFASPNNVMQGHDKTTNGMYDNIIKSESMPETNSSKPQLYSVVNKKRNTSCTEITQEDHTSSTQGSIGDADRVSIEEECSQILKNSSSDDMNI